jgi:hypothetical protein
MHNRLKRRDDRGDEEVAPCDEALIGVGVPRIEFAFSLSFGSFRGSGE